MSSRSSVISVISVIFISFLIFWLLFAPKSAIIPDSTISGWIANSISLFLIWYVRKDLKYIIIGSNKTFNLLMLAYLAIAVYSVYYNIDTIDKYELENIEKAPHAITSTRHLFYYSIGLLASSLYIQRIANTEYIRILFKTFIVLLLIVLIASYIEVLTKPIENGVLGGFSAGNKFTIGYYHLYLCAFYYLLNRNQHKSGLFVLAFLMLISAIVTQCSTMIMGSLAYIFLSLFASDSLRNFLSSSKVIFISVLVFDIGFFFLGTWIIQYDFIQHIIVDVLNEDITLTGRLEIFIDIQEAFAESPWVGFGYGNSLVVSAFYTGAYNSQNGLIDLFIQVGIIGVVLFLLLVYTASKTFEKNNISKFPYVAFIYTIIVISTVEIPFKHNFIFFLSFCFIQGKGYSKTLIKHSGDRFKQKRYWLK